MSRWFRHYAGMMRDDKLVRVAIRSGQTIERVVWVYGAILESASEVNQDGTYDVDASEIAYFLRADETDIHAVFSNLEAAGHITEGRVVKWSDRQFKSDSSADRQAAYRQRKRGKDVDNGEAATSQNAGVTSPSRHRDAPETETELDTELEKEKMVAIASCLRVAFPCPDGVTDEQWAAFRSQRKKKLNPRSYLLLTNKLLELAEAGWPPGEMIDLATERGWETVFAPRSFSNERSSSPTTDALARVQAAIRSGSALG